jgi:hypothetical protein
MAYVALIAIETYLDTLDQRAVKKRRFLQTAPALASSRIRACEIGGLAAAWLPAVRETLRAGS